MRGNTQLITGLDVDTRDEALAAVDIAAGCNWFKIGAQLFTRCGPDIVRAVQDKGKQVFLDLKYHDIPNTVAKASKAAAELDAKLFTLHAAGGKSMIAAAREAVEGSDTKILAVTVLTSLTDDMLRNEIGIPETAAEAVPRLARQAVESGAHGIVCSPREITMVREAVGPDALIVTPGIRPKWASKDDQARIMTPREAAEAGADMIVVVRPILKHENPPEAVRMILEELQG